MTKGARAMAVAMLYPEPENVYRGKKIETGKLLKTEGFSAALLSQERTVLAHSKPLAESVLAGVKPLDVAYQTAVKSADRVGHQASGLIECGHPY